MKCNVWNPSTNFHYLDLIQFFLLKIFLSNLLLKIISSVLLTNHLDLEDHDLSYISSSQFLRFLGWWAALWEKCKNCAKRKHFNSNLSNAIICGVLGKAMQCSNISCTYVSALQAQCHAKWLRPEGLQRDLAPCGNQTHASKLTATCLNH